MTIANILYIRALDCAVSSHNVRTQSDEAADAELEVNIGETGIVLQNLIGLPISRKKGHYEIVGGGRRLECVHRNIASGKLDEDFMVPVLVVKNARSAIEMSFGENYYNLPMNPADECRAFQGMIEREKRTPADVAKRFGKTERFVLGRLRLANIATPIFEALRSGEITLDVAKAYAATADTDRQAKVFGELEGHYYQSNLNEIRRQLATGSFKGADPKAMLVGRDAYLEAGGRIETDLFSDQATETWRDGDLVETLAAEAMASAAAALREREGFAEVRAIAAPSIPYSQTCSLTRVDPSPTPFNPEAQARHDEITARLEAIENEAKDEESYTDEQSEELDALNEEMENLVEASLELTQEQKAGVIAYLILDSDGNPQLHHKYFAKETEVGADDSDDGGDDPDDKIEVEDDGNSEEDRADLAPNDGADEIYSQRLLDELASMKTELLAVHVANDPRFAMDLAIFIMADRSSPAGWTGMPSELSASPAGPRIHGFESETKAAADWTALTEGLDRSWQAHATLAERYDVFCSLEEKARMAWLGWAVARTLHAVPHGQRGANFLDHLGVKLAIDVASWWRPTARNFFDRLTKPRILDLFEAIGGAELRGRHMGSRKFDLAVSAERLFAGDAVTEVDIKDRLVSWLPQPMAFAGEVLTPEEADSGLEGDEPADCADGEDLPAAA